MLPEIDHVLFDCDGTLFDTEGLKARSWGVALASALDLATLFASYYRAGATAREVADDLLRRCRPDLLQQVARRYAEVDPDQVVQIRADEKDRLFAEALAREREFAAGQGPLLRAPAWRLALEARERFPTGLVSASQLEWVERYFAASRPLDSRGQPVVDPAAFFRPVVCGLKKSAGIQRAVCEALGVSDYAAVPPEQRARFVIFEDSLEGLREAKAVGIRTVAVPAALAADPAIADVADLFLPVGSVEGWHIADVVRALSGRTAP